MKIKDSIAYNADIGKLEYQLDQLLDLLDQLRDEKFSLQQQLTQLLKENEQREQKQHAQLTKLKKLITELKGSLL